LLTAFEALLGGLFAGLTLAQPVSRLHVVRHVDYLVQQVTMCIQHGGISGLPVALDKASGMVRVRYIILLLGHGVGLPSC